MPGHWEADLMMFSKYGQAVLTVHERTSRLLLDIRIAVRSRSMPSDTVKPMSRRLFATARIIGGLGKPLTWL